MFYNLTYTHMDICERTLQRILIITVIFPSGEEHKVFVENINEMKKKILGNATGS